MLFAMAVKKQTTLSGMQPSGRLHVGNYLGALQNFVALQRRCVGFFMIADEHSLTEGLSPAALRQQTLDLAAAYLAAGLDPRRSTIFLQSLVPEHLELAWVFSCLTSVGELERMTQFKDKAARQKTNVNAGLLTYPLLMAADILIYKPAVVPVGDDQTQHLELARRIARKFNARFGATFPEPKPLYTAVPRLMSLSDPTRKMSKSEPEGCLFLDDPPGTIEQKIKRAVTDTKPAPGGDMSPGVRNLFLVLRVFSDAKTVKQFEAAHRNGTIRYRELKATLGQDIAKGLSPFQKKYAALRAKPKQLLAVLTDGSQRARKISSKTMKQPREKIGLLA
jgi:tryptophanyl-tRNA synthetase